jgi:hypothetical protein
MADWTWIRYLAPLVSWLSRKSSIPYLDVIPRPGKATVGGQPLDAVYFKFTNTTQSVVVLHRARLRENQKNFPAIGEQDISEGWRILKFMDPSGIYTEREFTMQPNSSAETLIPLTRQLDDSFDSYRPGRFRKWFIRPKYFAIQYTATVGRETHTVEFVR